MKQNILNDFFIIIKDNFLDQKLLLELQQTLPTLNYEAQRNTIENINHIWFSADADNNVAEIVKDKCEKILNKKLKIKFCSYTLLATVNPLPHCDKSELCDYQVIIYIKGDTDLHKGTGFYLNNKKNKEYELNTHVGFNENRAVLWHSNTWHTPMNWAADNKSKRYSIICQFKEL